MKKRICGMIIIALSICFTQPSLPVVAVNEQVIIENENFFYDENTIKTSIINGEYCFVTDINFNPDSTNPSAFKFTQVNANGQITRRGYVRVDSSEGDLIKSLSEGDVFEISGSWTPNEIAMVEILDDGEIIPIEYEILHPGEDARIEVQGNMYSLLGEDFSTVIVHENELPRDGNVNETRWSYGDGNLDGTVDIVDVIVVNKAVLGSAKLTYAQKSVVDVDQNGIVDSTDSLMILKEVVEVTKDFVEK